MGVTRACETSRHVDTFRLIRYCKENGALVETFGASKTHSTGQKEPFVVQKQSRCANGGAEETYADGQFLIRRRALVKVSFI